MNIDASCYESEPNSKHLEKLEDPSNPDLNSISANTLANLILNQKQPYLIIDCRFDYEYNGGHIKNALNFSSPEHMESFFFTDAYRIAKLMKTIVIFHCEFSQHRGPKMYRSLRAIDRELHMQFYP